LWLSLQQPAKPRGEGEWHKRFVGFSYQWRERREKQLGKGNRKKIHGKERRGKVEPRKMNISFDSQGKERGGRGEKKGGGEGGECSRFGS